MKKQIGKSPPGDFLSTSNIFVAAYAMATGCKIVDVDKTDRKKSIILLEGEGAALRSNEFYDDFEISAKAYADAYRTLKDRIFERE